MINKITGSFFFIELIIALSIAVYWTSTGTTFHTIKLGNDFLSFLNNTSLQLQQNKFSIPNIPKIPAIEKLDNMENPDWWNAVLNFFVSFANGFFTFINGVTSVINFLITIINYVIELIQFIALLLGNLLNLIGSLRSQPVPA